MKTYIQSFINLIKAKTGIELSVFPLEDFPSFDASVCDNGAYQDVINGYTLFLTECKSEKYVCKLEGATEHQKRYAVLIKELANDYFKQEDRLSKEEFYKSVLYGEMTISEIGKYLKKFSIADMPCTAMVIPTDSEEVFDVVYNYCEDGADYALKTDKEVVVIKYRPKNEEYRSGTEYAGYIAQSVLEEVGVEIKIYIGGIVNSLSDLHVSFNQAVTASRLADGFEASGSVHSFREFLALKIIEDLPKQKLTEYLSAVYDDTANEVFEDVELVNTAEGFLESGLNLSEAARKLFIHRNTLSYRLDKIEKATGLNIRKFSDAVTFRLIMHVLKLIK